MWIPGYDTRPFRGDADLAGMAAVINARIDSEQGEDYVTVGTLAQQYQHLVNCDPLTDILVAESDGVVVGYARTMWSDVAEGYRQYWVVAESHPGHPDLRERLYGWVEERAARVASGHPPGEKYLTMWADRASSRARVLSARGYDEFRYGAEMVRPHLDDIPERSLPDGVELRAVEEGHLRAIWEADREAFRDAWGFTEPTEEEWLAWREDPNWNPGLWRVAWAGDRVVGQVRSFIDWEENRRLARLRGWTENISTVRDWRSQGIAGALICSSLRALREVGMREAGLGVDTDSPTGAQRLYRSLGFEPTRLEALYRRRLPPS